MRMLPQVIKLRSVGQIYEFPAHYRLNFWWKKFSKKILLAQKNRRQGDSCRVVLRFYFIFGSKSPKNTLLSIERQKRRQLLNTLSVPKLGLLKIMNFGNRNDASHSEWPFLRNFQNDANKFPKNQIGWPAWPILSGFRFPICQHFA